MNPSRDYKRTESVSDKDVVFAVRESEKEHESYQDDLGVLKMTPGHWNVLNPKQPEHWAPKDENGNPALFSAYPSCIDSLHKTPNLTSKGTQHLLALAHQEAKKHGKGTLSYGFSLSPDSSPLVLHALDQGYLEENESHPREELESSAARRAEERAVYHEEDEDYKKTARIRKMQRKTSGGHTARENYEDIIERRGAVEQWDNYDDDDDDTVEESWTTDPDWEEIENLPRTAGQDAVNAVKGERNRKQAQRELPEPPQAPVEHEGNLWDHASRKDKKSWNASSGIPTASRAGAFKDYVGGIASRVRGN